MQSSHDFNIVFSYLWQDLGQYFQQDELSLAQRIRGHETYLRELHQQSMALYDCIDLTPRERQAAHFLAVLTRYQEILHFHQQSNEPLTIDQSNGIDALKRQLNQALDEYGVNLSKRKLKNLRDILNRYLLNKFAPPVTHKQLNRASIWQEIARQIADEIWEANFKRDADWKLNTLANKVHTEMRARQIVGPHGRTPGPTTIVKEALGGARWYQAHEPKRAWGSREVEGNTK